MIAEAGHYALVLALALALIQSTVPLLGARWGDHALMNVARSAALAQLLFAAISFALLTMLYVVSDFSVVNVFENSHSMKPLLYKITGVWGNHEGSMLLWVSILALFGGLVAAFGNNLPLSLRAHVLAVQGWIAAAFYLFILMTSNPFLRIASPPIEGRDLNPVLQDIGLAVHPPMLYLGYVGFSISFSFAVAALIEGRIDAAWARWVRPWTLVAWIFLTLGIAMGSYWAYYELGWGGWWFWDPVENASLMPWLAGTALLHSAVVMEKRNALKVWTILLSILTFSLSLLGTFLVRSGVLTSVHAFATDPTRGVFILLILCLFIGGSLLLYAWRASALKQGGLFAPISREGALVLNNLFLTTACATVFIGTLYPLALEVLTGDKISVGAPFFNLTFGPLFVPLMVAMPFGPLLAWKRGDLAGASQRLMAAGIAALIAIAVLLAWTRGGATLAPLAIGLGIFVIAGALTDLVERTALFRAPLATALARARGLPRATWGTAFAHAGIGVALIGIVCETTWNSEYIGSMKPNETATVAGYQLKLDGVTQRQGPNFREMIAQFTVTLDGETLRVMTPSKRNFTTRGSSTTEAALLTRGASQLYVSLGDPNAEGAIAVRIYHKPLVLFIWWGPVLMAFGGLLSLSDRRLRVGAPKPAKPAARLAAGGVRPLRKAHRQRIRRRHDGRKPGRPCGAARRDHVGSREGSARARPVARAALHGVPEPVDRRFRRAAGARPAASGARAHRDRRQRQPGDRFPGGALWRVRAAEAALHAAHGIAVAAAAAGVDRGRRGAVALQPPPHEHRRRDRSRAAAPDGRGGGKPGAPACRRCAGQEGLSRRCKRKGFR